MFDAYQFSQNIEYGTKTINGNALIKITYVIDIFQLLLDLLAV